MQIKSNTFKSGQLSMTQRQEEGRGHQAVSPICLHSAFFYCISYHCVAIKFCTYVGFQIIQLLFLIFHSSRTLCYLHFSVIFSLDSTGVCIGILCNLFQKYLKIVKTEWNIVSNQGSLLVNMSYGLCRTVIPSSAL